MKIQAVFNVTLIGLVVNGSKISQGVSVYGVNKFYMGDAQFENNLILGNFVGFFNFFDNNSSVSLLNVLFYNNTSQASIVSSFINISDVTNSSISLNSLIFSYNSGVSQLQLLYIKNNTFSIKFEKSSILNNESPSNTSPLLSFSAINFMNFTTISLISNNKIYNKGGTLISITYFNEFLLYSSNFIENYAYGSTAILEINNLIDTAIISYVLIENCSFSNNFMNYPKNLSNDDFIINYQDLKGGAVFLFYRGVTDINITSFINNTIIIDDLNLNIASSCIFAPLSLTPHKLMINNSNFRSNVAFSISTCVFFEGSYFSLTNSIISSNSMLKAPFLSSISSKWKAGSSIFLNSLSFFIENCSFLSNSGVSGASIYVLLDFSGSNLILMMSFQDFYVDVGRYELKGVTISDCVSNDDGAAININVLSFFHNLTFSFNDCVFIDNFSYQDGGVLKLLGYFLTMASLIFQKVSFIHNEALRAGVLFNNFVSGFIELNSCNFLNNTAFSLVEGGGVFYNSLYQDFLTSNCTFLNNFAQNRASIIFLYHGSYSDYGSIYNNNTAGNEAGMVILIDDTMLSMNYSLVNISSSVQKAGFALIMKGSQLQLNKCMFYNITSNKGGFIVAGQESMTNITNSLLENFRCYEEIVLVLGVDNMFMMVNVSINQWTTIEKTHFYIRNNNFQLENINVNNSVGALIYSKYCFISIINLTLYQVQCPDEDIENFMEYCLFSFSNSLININGFSAKNIILSDRQSLSQVISSNFSLENAIISGIYTDDPFLASVFYTNFLFFMMECNYSIIDSNISDINLTAFQIIISSGLFKNIILLNTLDENLTIQGQFISCFICISLELSLCNISGMISDIAPVLQINDLYQSFFYQTLRGYDFESFGTNNRSLYIHESNFSNNIATVKGGVIYVIDFSLLISNCIFSNNTADVGGAIYLNCSDLLEEMNCYWTIENTIFLNNKAYTRGGVLHWLNRMPILSKDTNIYINNTAKQGSILSSNPIQLQLVNQNDVQVFVSGSYTNATLVFNLLDAYGQIYEDANSLAYMKFDKNNSLTHGLQKFVGNQFVLQNENGSYNFSDFNIISDPGKNASLLVYTDSIPFVSKYLNLSYTSSNINNNINYFYSVVVSLRKCNKGEIFFNDSNLCFPCSDGFFSFNTSDTVCTECPLNAICLKNQPFKVMKGYWRISENSSKLYRCNIKKAGCIGGTFEDQCLFGYTGPLCSGCLYDDNDKFFNSFGGCSKCGSSNTFLILITVIVLLVGMAGLIFFSIKDSQTFSETEDTKEVLVTVLINILINYIQLFSIISNIDIQWPSFFSSSSSSSSSPTSITDFIGVLECPIASFAHSHNYSIFYVEMIMMAFLFIGMLIGNIMFWIIFKMIRKRFYKINTDLKNNIILTYIAIYVLMLQPLINFYTKGFSCIEVGDGFVTKHFLKVAPSIECWEDIHMSLITNVIVPFSLIFILPPPLIMIIYIYKHWKILRKSNKEKADKEVIQKMFMVTIGYRDKYCYWEFVILLKKIILMYLSIFIRDEPVICVLTLLFVLLIFCNLHVIFNPYLYPFLNNLIFEQYAALFICYSVFLYFSYTESVSGSVILIMIMFSANIVFFVHWIALFYKYIKKSIANILKKTTDMINFNKITSALRRMENNRKRNALMRSQTSLSQTKLSPRGSKFIQKSSGEIKDNNDGKKALKTTPGKSSHVGSGEECEVIENPFRSERKDEACCEKFREEMLIIIEEKLEK